MGASPTYLDEHGLKPSPPSLQMRRTLGGGKHRGGCLELSCEPVLPLEAKWASPMETVDPRIDYVQITSRPNFKSGAVDTGSG
jgi:hypothetical protein